MLKKVLPLMLVASMSHAADEVRIYNWSGYVADDTMANFKAQTSLDAHYDVYDSNEILDAKLMTGHSGYDVVFPSNHFMPRQIKSGALKKLDKSKLPNWKNLDPELLQAAAVNDPGNQYGFPYVWGTTGIGYNVDKVRAVLGPEQALDSWDLIFKPELLEKLSRCGVAVVDNAPEMLPIALHYLGLPHHSTNVNDYKKAEVLLKQMRRNVTYFHSSKYVADLANGDICVVVGFSGDVLEAATSAAEAKNGIQINYVVPKEGAPTWFDMVTMPADAPNEAAGYAFMNFLLQPEVMASVTNAIKYANANKAADALVDPSLRADIKVYPSPQIIGTLYPLEAVPPSIDRVRTRIWNSVISGK
ncbi:polyamine ABC transporter substrate-binding protein [Pseudomonas nitroreducens]|uniref:polyamine ABC transporter substrate-binding protein n=1 Tax=Pseudomonas nitroreducens TaxID=46680 RepID=UPI00209FB227|nr:polyamine ABC transporter substrate-binding protein [Pseudomonas nitroreducens]MCP1626294.1 putrescine transport system substrate-binding protein [Pseudomonas nitroreducens]